MVLDCADFEHRESFAEFVSLIVDETNGDLSLAAQCTEQICQQLWGTGNADISGIGMAVGYVAANILGPTLTLLRMYSHQGRQWWPMNRPQLLQDMLDSFHESALFFALSVQIACTVVLTRVTFGMNADGMGNMTVRITWTVATLCMLPLTYRTFLIDASGPNRIDHRHARSSAREAFIFPLFTICWIVFLYTVYSRMASTFAPSQIGSGDGAVIGEDDWETIAGMCMVSWDGIPPATDWAINAVGIAASLIVSILGFSRVVYIITMSWGHDLLSGKRANWFHTTWYYLRLCLWFMFPGLAATLIWGFFTLQASQKDLARAIDENDQDWEWTFGQVISVAVFTPVLVELVGSIVAPKHEYMLTGV